MSGGPTDRPLVLVAERTLLLDHVEAGRLQGQAERRQREVVAVLVGKVPERTIRQDPVEVRHLDEKWSIGHRLAKSGQKSHRIIDVLKHVPQNHESCIWQETRVVGGSISEAEVAVVCRTATRVDADA